MHVCRFVPFSITPVERETHRPTERVRKGGRETRGSEKESWMSQTTCITKWGKFSLAFSLEGRGKEDGMNARIKRHTCHPFAIAHTVKAHLLASA